jgi:hypothetical protein
VKIRCSSLKRLSPSFSSKDSSRASEFSRKHLAIVR